MDQPTTDPEITSPASQNIETRFRKHVKIVTVLFWIGAAFSTVNCLSNDRTQLVNTLIVFGVTGAIILSAFPERRNWARRYVILTGCYSLYTALEMLRATLVTIRSQDLATGVLIVLWTITAITLLLNGYWAFLSWQLLQPDFRSLFTSEPPRPVFRFLLYGVSAFLAVLALSPYSEKLRQVNSKLAARNAVSFHAKAEKTVGFSLPFWGEASIELSRPDLNVVSFYSKSPSQTLASEFWLFVTPGDKEPNLGQILKELPWREEGNRSSLLAPLGDFQSDLTCETVYPIPVPLNQGMTTALWVFYPYTHTNGVYFEWRGKERSYIVLGVNVTQKDGNEFIAKLVSKNPHYVMPPDQLTKLLARSKKGEAETQLLLGNLYRAGAGVPQDDKQAMYWFRQSADQKNAQAAFNLAMLYDSSPEASERQKSLQWLTTAAEYNHSYAQMTLITLYCGNHPEVPKDYSKAYFWTLVLAGSKPSEELSQKMAKQIAKQLTPEQIATITTQVQNWKPKI